MTSRLNFTLCTFLSLSASLSYGQSKGRILILVANGVAEKNAPLQPRSSLWEAAPAYHVFKIHGYDVISSHPRGAKFNLEWMRMRWTQRADQEWRPVSTQGGLEE